MVAQRKETLLFFIFLLPFRQQQQQLTTDNKVNKIARQGKRDFPLLIAPKRSSPRRESSQAILT